MRQVSAPLCHRSLCVRGYGQGDTLVCGCRTSSAAVVERSVVGRARRERKWIVSRNVRLCHLLVSESPVSVGGSRLAVHRWNLPNQKSRRCGVWKRKLPAV